MPTNSKDSSRNILSTSNINAPSSLREAHEIQRVLQRDDYDAIQAAAPIVAAAEQLWDELLAAEY